jgi:hypothetical protein
METIMDACPSVAANSPRRHLFTAANAKEMSARGNAAKALAKKRREELIAKTNAIPTLQRDEIYRNQRLARVRVQLERLDGELERTKDARDVKAICDAIARLAEVERILAGRPLPGSRRPGREKPQRGTVSESPAVDD